MITNYRLHTNELSIEWIRSIKQKFKNAVVNITISDEGDETDYLLSTEANRKSLERSLYQAEHGDLIAMTVEELQAKYGRQ